MPYIRSVKHSIKFSNTNKLEKVNQFLIEYQRVGQFIIDEIWARGYGEFQVWEDKLNLGKYINYKTLNIETNLSARALSCIATQVAGILSSQTEKRRRLLWVKEKLEKENQSTVSIVKKLNEDKYQLVKPKMPFSACLNSLNSDIKRVDNEFDLFICLKTLGKDYGKIKVPLKLTKRDIYWENKGAERLVGFVLTKNNITLCYKITNDKKKSGDKIVGADQGLKTVLTLSNGNTTPDSDKDGYSLQSICNKVSRKKKGSKAFKKAQDHRKNFINWSINQLNLKDIDEIRLEDVVNINFGKKASRKMQAWTNTEIRGKVERYAEENEVRFVLQESTYKSQRCSCCGQVRKSNRKGKIYSCKHCGNTMDSDLNAAKNHEQNLPDIPFGFRNRKLNLKNGFFWKPNGFFNFDGSELIVPVSYKKNNFL